MLSLHCAILLPWLLMTTAQAADLTLYIGTRTREGRSDGIYRATFDPARGTLRDVTLAAKTIDPSFLALHPTRPLLFAVVAAPEGKVRAFAIEADGGLRLLNEVSSKGAGPAHVQIDRSGNFVAAANYTDGSAAIFRIEHDGHLSEAVDSVQHQGRSVHETRQSGPHAHSAYFSAGNTELYIADLGLDEVKVYGFDARTGKLTPKPSWITPKGAGPRHMALGKKRAYVLNELSSSVSVFENGKLLETVSALPAGFTGESTAAEVIFDRGEKHLYASNRGADTIAVFRIASKGLKKIADLKVGRGPRNFVLSPDEKYLLVASQLDDTIQAYRMEKGIPREAVGAPAKAGSPICLRFERSKSK